MSTISLRDRSITTPSAAALAWRQALLAVAAVAVTLGLIQAFPPARGALVLGAALALTLSRNRLLASRRGRIELALLLPLVSLLTIGVGLLLRHAPLAGALAYIAGMFLSIWLRRYGPAGSRIGSLLALPFITLLVVPGGGAPPWIAAAVGLLALLVAMILRLLAHAAHFLPPEPAEAAPKEDAAPARASSLRPIASTRMAIQLALALAVAFACAALLFRDHATWVVLAALLIFTGNRGRADVLYKGGLRVAGVALGTVIGGGVTAAMAAGRLPAHGVPLAALMLAIVGVGLGLRQWSYAAWACAMTLVIALLQDVVVAAPGGASQALWMRVLATVVGAACSIVAAWLVLPVRSEPVLRRRIADALAALGEYLAEPLPERGRSVAAALARVEEVAPPWEAWDRVVRHWRPDAPRPGQWARLTRECVALARSRPGAGGPARKLLGEARRSLREPARIGPALAALREALAA